MTISVYFSNDLGFRVHRFGGVVSPAQVAALADFYRANRWLVPTDLISIIDESAGGASALLMQHMAALRELFKELHVTSDFLLLRRSAWVCANPGAWTVLEAWLRERHSRDGQGTEVCLVTTLEEADCLFDPDEIHAVVEWRGFDELWSIDAGPGSLSISA